MYDRSELALEVLSEFQRADERLVTVSHEDVITYFMYAETDIALYLNTKLPLPDEFIPKIKELAKLKITGDHLASNQLKARSYQEGEISESETYLTADDIKSRESILLSSLNTYRRCRIVT